jgi:hypothetical protein
MYNEEIFTAEVAEEGEDENLKCEVSNLLSADSNSCLSSATSASSAVNFSSYFKAQIYIKEQGGHKEPPHF